MVDVRAPSRLGKKIEPEHRATLEPTTDAIAAQAAR
jgi:hypothetical protein